MYYYRQTLYFIRETQMKNSERLKGLKLHQISKIVFDWIYDAGMFPTIKIDTYYGSDYYYHHQKMIYESRQHYLNEWKKSGSIIIGTRCIILEKRK